MIRRLIIFTILSAMFNMSEAVESVADIGFDPHSETFVLQEGKNASLHGRIIKDRYYAPENIFSCHAEYLNNGEYIAQDGLFSNWLVPFKNPRRVCVVGFYNDEAAFKKVEVLIQPEIEKIEFKQKELQQRLNDFAIDILKRVDKAEGIQILQEEMIRDNMFFMALTIDKMAVLKLPNGKYVPCTRGYLGFKEKDKFVILTNQIVTFPDEKHTPKAHIKKLRQEILAFKETLELDPFPIAEKSELDNLGEIMNELRQRYGFYDVPQPQS